ncbi:MAG TPA: flagellar assembly protein FliW [Limnochordales bacterium]
MLVRSSRFGTLEVDGQQAIHFPRGFVGFPEWRSFVVLPHAPDSPFAILQSLDDPDLALTVVDPRVVQPDYVARVPASELACIGLREPQQLQQAVVLAVVTIPKGDVRQATVNLLAPLVINPVTRQALQVVLEGHGYSVRHPLFGSPPPAPARAVGPAVAAAAGG